MSPDRKKWVRGWWIGFALAIVWCAVVMLATAMDDAESEASGPAQVYFGRSA